jgi:hypothetical protein
VIEQCIEEALAGLVFETASWHVRRTVSAKSIARTHPERDVDGRPLEERARTYRLRVFRKGA